MKRSRGKEGIAAKIAAFAMLIVLCNSATMSLRAQCTCNDISISIQPTEGLNDPCASLTEGSCGTCSCSYIEIQNSNQPNNCGIYEVDITAPDGACSNYCAYFKDNIPPYPKQWDQSDPPHSKCDPAPLFVSFNRPAPGTYDLEPYSGPLPDTYYSVLVIKVCTTTPLLSYTLTFHFNNGTNCTKPIIL
jgi:hypothetical protein